MKDQRPHIFDLKNKIIELIRKEIKKEKFVLGGIYYPKKKFLTEINDILGYSVRTIKIIHENEKHVWQAGARRRTQHLRHRPRRRFAP